MTDFYRHEFEQMDSEFDDRSAEEMYEDFLESVQKPNDEFVYYYGAYCDVMKELTTAAMNLFAWMAFRCEVNTGRVLIQSMTQRDAMKDLDITISTFYKSLALLKEKGMIKGSNAKYFVNPMYAWKGTAGMRSKFLKIYYKL